MSIGYTSMSRFASLNTRVAWGGRTVQSPVKSLIVLTDQAEHARRRQSWTRALNTASIKELGPTLASRVDQLVECIANQNGAVDLSKWVSFFS